MARVYEGSAAGDARGYVENRHGALMRSVKDQMLSEESEFGDDLWLERCCRPDAKPTNGPHTCKQPVGSTESRPTHGAERKAFLGAVFCQYGGKMFGSRDLQILLVEPDPAEAGRATATLKRAKVRTHVTLAADAGEALAHLRREAHHYRSPRPNLILLSGDNLEQQGEELLAAIKSDARLSHIPVVFMSNSEADGQVTRAYDLLANCYVHKPMSEEDLERVLETTREFWLSIVKLPTD